MKSYFFIPANNEKFLKQATNIESDEIILDLEDAIHNTNVDEAINNILNYNLPNHTYTRVINTYKTTSGNYKYLLPLLKEGFHRFVLPKVENSKEIEEFALFISKNLRKDPRLIVLIESPKALIFLDEIAQTEYVEAIGLGSHDYCDAMGMEHTSENILWARMKILNTAKAFEKETIDIASMNINDENEFQNECRDGISKGFESKFIIHPWQLNILKNLSNFTAKDILFAKKVKQYIDDIGGKSNFTIAKIEGQILEKPHLKRINNILKSIGYDTI
ncbi:HpcH/HpaI aldolase/citrate lyase family protein [Marivirga sp.]|uniref:HpcH/HpaI aldolase/citrate lyase family protein n=1 Tax=Marivirga sp. TaxID=2018662 RepID=UPI002D803F6C|nr:aldolase/citrate lyase family protein [Marivirga sp.]HET8858759.1 aldolase/citrate lyase family protein [Marivirga sp.]